MNISQVFRYKTHQLILFILWTGVWVYYSIYYGPIVMGDTYQYLQRAEELHHSQVPDFRYFWYIGYIGFLSLISFCSDDTLLIAVIFQVLISGLAAVFVYRSTFILSQNVISAFLATLLFIGWHKVQVWNFFVLTESLFISFLVFLFYAILKRNAWLVILFSILLLFTRPSGIIVLTSTLVSFLFYGWHKNTVSRKFIFMGVILLLIAGAVSNKILTHYDLVEQYSSGKIVYSADAVKDKKLSEGLFIYPEKVLEIPVQSGQAILDVFRFFMANPGYSLRLVYTKALWFIWDYRPYHSYLHLSVNILLLLFCYMFTLNYMFRKHPHKLATTWFLIFFMGNVLMASFTYLTWEGRFFAPLYPFLFIFACCGLYPSGFKGFRKEIKMIDSVY